MWITAVITGSSERLVVKQTADKSSFKLVLHSQKVVVCQEGAIFTAHCQDLVYELGFFKMHFKTNAEQVSVVSDF